VAKRNQTVRAVPAGQDSAPSIRSEFDEALYDLSCAISVVKTLNAALEGEDPPLEWGIRDQTMIVAIEGLDAAYNKLDLAIVHLARQDAPTEVRS
jgi:hypothetical protein